MTTTGNRLNSNFSNNWRVNMEKKSELSGLGLLRAPFPAHQISKLPKPTKAQTDEVKQNFKAGIRCTICGTWHHPKVVHLDYVGHAALTDRLLDADPAWNWEPVATNQDGTPVLDKDGGMWIRLTVCGVTRLGYGDAEGKTGPAAMKERIGDALRNAAMRFGAALELWHKGELHVADELGGEAEKTAESDAKEKAELEYAKYKDEHLPKLRAASFNGLDALTAEFKKLEKSDFKAALWTEHGGTLKEGAELAQKGAA
jgi:hypothetical protein